MSNINFKERVQAMSAKEIIMAMVNGLKNPATDVVDMGTFGEVNDYICYGCAATNTICNIAGVTNLKPIFDCHTYMSFGSRNVTFLYIFESAINYLRQGDIGGYNNYAHDLSISIITWDGDKLPYLDNESYLENLDAYIALAEAQI